MPVTQLNHYLLVAKNLEKTKDFYQNVLGLELAERISAFRAIGSRPAKTSACTLRRRSRTRRATCSC